MVAMSEAPSPLPPPSQTTGQSALDAMFGVHTHQLGDATLRIRRVLTVEQQRMMYAVVDAQVEASRQANEINKMPRETTEERAAIDLATEPLEARLRVSLIDAINMMTIEPIPELNTLGLTTLTWFFTELRNVVERKTEAAVNKLGFPTSGV